MWGLCNFGPWYSVFILSFLTRRGIRWEISFSCFPQKVLLRICSLCGVLKPPLLSCKKEEGCGVMKLIFNSNLWSSISNGKNRILEGWICGKSPGSLSILPQIPKMIIWFLAMPYNCKAWLVKEHVSRMIRT